MEEAIESQLRDFERDSKSGVGVHMFVFERAGAEPVYLGSEVTDDNNVLDVVYHEWTRQYIRDDDGGLKEAWKTSHRFHNGRALLAAVAHLLRQGYTMQSIKP